MQGFEFQSRVKLVGFNLTWNPSASFVFRRDKKHGAILKIQSFDKKPSHAVSYRTADHVVFIECKSGNRRLLCNFSSGSRDISGNILSTFDIMFRRERFRMEQVIRFEPPPTVSHHNQIEIMPPCRGVVQKIIARIMDIAFQIGSQQQISTDVVREGIRFDGIGIGYAGYSS